MKNILMACLLLTNIMMAKVDFNFEGEGVAYYQTNNAKNSGFFAQENSKGSLGLEFDLKVKLGKNFKLGYQETFLGTLGLENDLLSTTRQYARANDSNARATTKLYVSNNFHNTVLKLGRQVLSMEYSPLAFSEDWNVFENTFDAVLLVNKDIENTIFITAYISKANGHNNLSSFNNLEIDNQEINSGIYLMTVKNKSIENLPIRASYYKDKESASAMWLDIKSNHNDLKLAFQAAQIDPKNNLKEVNILGAKVSSNYENMALSLAYSLVSDGDVSFQNLGTKGDVAFYTQMVNNQDFIARDAQTTVLKTVIQLPRGNLTFGYGLTQDNSLLKNDFSELDVVYKFDLLDTKMFVGYIRQETKLNSFEGKDSSDNIRIWSRYNF